MPCQIFSVSFELKDLIINTFYDTNAKGKYIFGESQGLFIKLMRPNGGSLNAAKVKPLQSDFELALLRLATCCTKSRPRQNLGTG